MADSAPAPVEPEAKKARVSPHDDLIATLRELGKRDDEPADSSPDAVRAAIFKIILKKMKERPSHVNFIRIIFQGDTKDMEYVTYRDHHTFTCNLLELRGWKCVADGSSWVQFELKSMDSAAAKFARELGWM